MNIKNRLFNSDNIYNLNLRVTYYARVSTDNDTQSSSIINQRDFFNKYINNINNWKLVEGYIDEGISGKDVKNRVNFLKMIKDGIDNKFDLILTKSVSRFARNTIDSIKYTDLLKSKGIGVIFINDNINTLSSDSEFRLTLMASIAQDEIRKLSDSVKFGLKQSINRGIVLGNSNILGYVKDKGKLRIIEEEAIIVRNIFNLFVTNNYSYSEVARIINSKYNKKYDSTSIKRILTNYKYKGYYCGKKSLVIDYKYNKRINIDKDNWVLYKDNENVPVIVEENIWDKANDIIRKRSINKGNNKYNNKIICVNHNIPYKYVSKRYKNKFYYYYVCNKCYSIKKEILDKICNFYCVKYIFIYKYDDYVKIFLNVNV